jgi:hypothetical protein
MENVPTAMPHHLPLHAIPAQHPKPDRNPTGRFSVKLLMANHFHPFIPLKPDHSAVIKQPCREIKSGSAQFINHERTITTT